MLRVRTGRVSSFLPPPLESTIKEDGILPKQITPELKDRAVRLVLDHREEYSSLTAAAATVARQLGLGKETVRRWAVQAEIDGGCRCGDTSEELAE